MLDADPAPAGTMPVVVGGGFGGVLFHEMTGHGLEADAVQKGASVYSGKLGEQVAEPIVNAYDDGLLPGEWGTNAIDDEGTPSNKTQVIEDGSITSYLYDLFRARRDDAKPTGNGRRESFRHLPIPRMTNTYIAPGDAKPEELIAEIPSGFYAKSFAGGQVDPATGDFVFGVSRGLPDRVGQGHQGLPRRDPDRQLPRRAARDRRRRRRLRDEDGLLRQGRPARPGRHRPGPRADPRADGRRDRGLG